MKVRSHFYFAVVVGSLCWLFLSPLGCGKGGPTGPSTPQITWDTPGPIVYGTALGAAQLNASANVAGSFAYSPARGTMLHPGSQVLSAIFTPTDTVNYTLASASLVLTVNPAEPALSWATPTAMTYGTALSAAQLNATVSVAGALT